MSNKISGSTNNKNERITLTKKAVKWDFRFDDVSIVVHRHIVHESLSFFNVKSMRKRRGEKKTRRERERERKKQERLLFNKRIRLQRKKERERKKAAKGDRNCRNKSHGATQFDSWIYLFLHMRVYIL